MGIFTRILNRHTEISGDLGYFGLGSWWLSAFSAAERHYVEAAFRMPDLPAGAKPLTRDCGLLAVQTAAELLVLMADGLSNRPEDRALASRVLAKAEERAIAGKDLIGLHFTYHQVIRLQLHWKEHFRDASDLAYAACHKQMRVAQEVAEAFHKRFPGKPLPVHLGYLYAAGILEQQEAYPQAIELCKQAEAAGWAGNWSWRLQRMARRVYEAGPPCKFISSSGIGPV